MAAGKLGAAALTTANSDIAIYPVPASTVATVNISVCNKGSASAKVRIAIGTGSAPAAGDFLEYDTTVPANGVLDRTGVVCSAGEKVFVRASTTDVCVRVHGFEEAA